MRRLRIHVFQHVAFEGPGALGPWALARGHSLSYTRLYAGGAPPAPDEYDWLIVMGGPMGVHDEKELPWLIAEKRALEAVLKTRKPVLGICLGAQLLADVLGARVTKNPEREIGWFPVELDAAARATWLGEAMPASFTPFHWHGDTFGIPQGAVPLGSSGACAHQGFLFGDRVLGWQFHPEVTRESLEALIENCGAELKADPSRGAGRFVQDAAALRAGLVGAPVLNKMAGEVCVRLEGLA
jgi:GMP synthase-like glutamine amidotransferase